MTPVDALAAINYLNSQSVHVGLPAAPLVSAYDYDVNDDQACTALDVLILINHLNADTDVPGEGEAMSRASWSVGPFGLKRKAAGKRASAADHSDMASDALPVSFNGVDDILSDITLDVLKGWERGAIGE